MYKSGLIHSMLETSAMQNPAKVAVVDGQLQLTYQEILAAANTLASYLRSQNVKPGERIGIFSAKCAQEVISLFAILKVGAVFVHINPLFKAEQLGHLIADCGIRTLFAHEMKLPVLRNLAGGQSCIKNIILFAQESPAQLDFAENIAFLPKIFQNPQPFEESVALEPRALASIIYTSGSKGMPKGVMVTHQIFWNATRISAQVLRNSDKDRIISTAPFSFDGALSQLFTAIMVGATCVLQRSSLPKDIVATLLDERITGFHAVPSLWNLLIHDHSPFPKHSYPNLRYISIIGEMVAERLVSKLKSILPHTDIFLMYGITEAFRSTYLPPEEIEIKPGSVGIPFPEVQIEIVGENRTSLPPGNVGEIVHSGAFISPGYWNAPDKSAQVFVDNKVYTGDLGYLDDEGYLYFLGRKDGMIKTSGYRVSPDEIEKCLYQMDGVKEAVVYGVSDPIIGQRVRAVIVSSADDQLSPKIVTDHCRKWLPHYMVPSEVEFRNELPKTATHKINRIELM